MENIRRHPIYNDYGADENGNCYSFKRDNIKLLKPGIKKGYQQISCRLIEIKKTIKLHKFVYECYNGLIYTDNKSGEGLTIDHIDNNKLNNRIDNLRIITHRENIQRNYNKESKYVGVYFMEDRNIFFARIKFRGKRKRLGYGSEIECAIAFDNEYEKHHGLRPNNTNEVTPKI